MGTNFGIGAGGLFTSVDVGEVGGLDAMRARDSTGSLVDIEECDGSTTNFSGRGGVGGNGWVTGIGCAGRIGSEGAAYLDCDFIGDAGGAAACGVVATSGSGAGENSRGGARIAEGGTGSGGTGSVGCSAGAGAGLGAGAGMGAPPPS